MSLAEQEAALIAIIESHQEAFFKAVKPYAERLAAIRALEPIYIPRHLIDPAVLDELEKEQRQ